MRAMRAKWQCCPSLNSCHGAHLCHVTSYHGTSVYGMLLVDEFMRMWEEQYKDKVNSERLERYCVDTGRGGL